MKRLLARIIPLSNRQHLWLILALALAGLALHFGTAALRFGTFLPYPKLLDFSAFYATAAALHQGQSPYGLPIEWLQDLRTTRAIPFTPPPIFNPPIWPWLLQPLEWLSFPLAAWLWLLINLAMLAWAALMLARLAGYRGWKAWGITYLLALTFGPVFLDLTLGQTSVFVLTMSLLIGQSLSCPRESHGWRGALAEGLATGAKLFPLLWLGALALLRRWKFLILGALAAGVALGAGFIVAPEGNHDYWFRFLPERITSASEQAGMDDQSFTAWLDRVGRSHAYRVPGLQTDEYTTIVWTSPWSVDPEVLRWGGYAICGLLILPVMLLLLRTDPNEAEGGFYLWVLYTLLIFPHIERYNHALLLPAMAWLWSRENWQRAFVVGAYLLTGLARLNHLWLILLPAPWGPLASGFGMYAVMLVGGGIAATLWPATRRDDTLCPTTS